MLPCLLSDFYLFSLRIVYKYSRKKNYKKNSYCLEEFNMNKNISPLNCNIENL